MTDTMAHMAVRMGHRCGTRDRNRECERPDAGCNSRMWLVRTNTFSGANGTTKNSLSELATNPDTPCTAFPY